MKRSPVYLRWREDPFEQVRREVWQEGFQKGFQEGQRIMKRQITECFFNVRFGSLDPELLAIIEPMLQLSPEELAPLLLNGSREELLQRFNG
ncbi:MAG: hypothetical protein F6K23_07615 [Okeania sp. SIO2C9]|uniref:hypothetical protein n=1 Tax=Okeania sp. SIO2C9 TaxID=2607791 RepID=UPI0013C00388|nr:hypothetical protein [Okeania sp. SIO2C9]NEQ72948.1 hypothetical protein [Okeania sp. SIO2C9]